MKFILNKTDTCKFFIFLIKLAAIRAVQAKTLLFNSKYDMHMNTAFIDMVRLLKLSNSRWFEGWTERNSKEILLKLNRIRIKNKYIPILKTTSVD